MTAHVMPQCFGYLDFVDLGNDAAPVWTGGYLIVSASGRPLEFHCTEPVAPSRAQQILHGRTLRPFLLGEHLGATLVGKAKLAPAVLLVADEHAVAAGRPRSIATALVRSEAQQAAEWRWVNEPADDRRATATELLDTLAESIDLAEPFDRIREAIAEAHGLTAGDEEAPRRDAA